MTDSEARVRSTLDAFSKGDSAAIRDCLAEDIVWHVGGDHPLAGEYRGRDAVIGYHQRVAEATAGTLSLDPVDIVANDRHAGIFIRVTGTRNGRSLDVEMAEAITFDDDGRWQEFWSLAEDQSTIDEFWR